MTVCYLLKWQFAHKNDIKKQRTVDADAEVGGWWTEEKIKPRQFRVLNTYTAVVYFKVNIYEMHS